MFEAANSCATEPAAKSSGNPDTQLLRLAAEFREIDAKRHALDANGAGGDYDAIDTRWWDRLEQIIGITAATSAGRKAKAWVFGAVLRDCAEEGEPVERCARSLVGDLLAGD